MEGETFHECPQPGMCLKLREDIVRMQAEINIRHSAADGLRKWLLSLVGLVLIQICTFIWWASSINSAVLMHTVQLTDHESRIRIEERN